MLYELLKEKHIAAFKQRNMLIKSAYSNVLAKALVAEKSGNYKLPLEDSVIESLIVKEIKELEETRSFYQPIDDKYEDLGIQIAELNQYLPKPLTETEVESMIFNKVNEERAKNGLAPLSYNSTMEHYARVKSQDMGDRGYFDHNNPEGELMTAQMLRDGVTYNAWGENIAYIGGISDANALANQFMTNWMNSSGHRANILSSNFTSIGVGVYKIGNTVYATQEFYR